VVKGLQRFREHFSEHADSFVVIGGVACDEWLGLQGLPFRPTRDVDMVLVIEALTPAFVSCFWEFVRAGKYDNRQQSTGARTYYRFSKPAKSDFPAMIEIFSRQPAGLDLAAGQDVVPIALDDELSSLSAILVDDDYYRLILDCKVMSHGLPIVPATALIPLKARAWLDLNQRRAEGQPVDANDIRKHRRDVFRLAAALPAGAGPGIAESVRADLQRFIAAFTLDSPEWPDLLKSLKADLGAAMPRPRDLLEALESYFSLTRKIVTQDSGGRMRSKG
jgi:hypothetical protein